jgi:hypothetical protein
MLAEKPGQQVADLAIVIDDKDMRRVLHDSCSAADIVSAIPAADTGIRLPTVTPARAVTLGNTNPPSLKSPCNRSFV